MTLGDRRARCRCAGRPSSGSVTPTRAPHQAHRPGRSVVSRPMSTLVLVLSLFADSFPAQEPPRPPATPPAVTLKRAVYEVRYGSAEALATALAQPYAAESSFRAVAAAGSNSLLLSAPPG